MGPFLRPKLDTYGHHRCGDYAEFEERLGYMIILNFLIKKFSYNCIYVCFVLLCFYMEGKLVRKLF